ncbi:MAG TPA: hypothetical protein VIF62_04760, partial [Labilithrix sp.]
MRIAASLSLAVALAIAAPGCRGPMAKIEGLRDALAGDDAAAVKSATSGLPSCPEMPPAALSAGQPSPLEKGCLSDLANAFGSQKGFVATPPDQAAGATVAVVLVRDGRGDLVADADRWLGALRAGHGAGLDALRLAVARKMEDAAPVVGRAIETDADARVAMKAIDAAIPGACPTYFLLGRGDDDASLPAPLSADHAACVQRDLSRREGPGGRYGTGTFRALEGALAIWRETERALRLGLPQAESGARSVVEKRLAIVQAATQKIATKKEAGVDNATLRFLGDI